MTVQEAISKWSEAAAVVKAGDTYIRDGNWQAITRALRHFVGEGLATVEEDEATLNGDTLIVVTPANYNPEGPHSPRNRPPFLLVVK